MRIELQLPWVRSKNAREGWIVHSHPFISLVSIYDCWIYLFLVHFPLEIEVQCHIHKSFSKRFWNFPLKLNNKAPLATPTFTSPAPLDRVCHFQLPDNSVRELCHVCLIDNSVIKLCLRSCCFLQYNRRCGALAHSAMDKQITTFMQGVILSMVLSK